MASSKKSTLLGATVIAGVCGFAALADIGPFAGNTSQRAILMLQPALTGIDFEARVTSADLVYTPHITRLTRSSDDSSDIPTGTSGYRTNATRPVVTVALRDSTGTVRNGTVNTITQKGELTILLNGAKAEFTKLREHDYEIDLESIQNVEVATISARWSVNGKASPAGNAPKRLYKNDSKAIRIHVDTDGPLLQSIDLNEEKKELRLKFASDDFGSSAETAAHYRIHKLDGDFQKRVHPDGSDDKVTDVAIHGRYVVLTLDPSIVVDGDYALEVTRSVTDAIGNRAGLRGIRDGVPVYDDQIKRYSVFGERKTGRHVEFPDFVERQRVPSDKVFNPGDSVETRVVRLYYYRDAHRVAQLLNRNVKQYNSAGVDRARRTADQAREAAESATDERRRRELDAIESAAERREVERDLKQARRALEETRARAGRVSELQNEIDRLTTQISDLTVQITAKQKEIDDLAVPGADSLEQAEASAQKRQLTQQKEELDNRKKQFEARKKDLTDEQGNLTQALVATQNRVNELDEELETTEVKETATRRKMIDADAREHRAEEHRFRAEVAAAKEDPDTYVPADLSSVDAVTQVSISVIGEGLMQLRGPIRGINRIRTMINQIDTPVGQVKVGIFTVQVNGEHGDRMENVATEIEGHIDLSRFLTNYSLGLIRQSVQEVASETVATIDQQFPSHRQVDRDRRYVYSFFGRDFVDELYEMDSEFLRTENKLLSLHAMDTVSLSQAMFVLALAKNDVRENILRRFSHYVDSEMPSAEWDFRQAAELKTKKMKKAEKLDQLEDKLWWRDSCGARSLQEVANIVHTKYRFRNFHSFFTANVTHSNAMTPMQREFIRLAQIFKSTMLAEMELKQRVVERGLIQQYTGDPSERLQRTIRFHNEAEQKLEAAERGRHYHASNVADVINKELVGRIGATVAAVAELEQFIRDDGLEDLIRQIGPDGLCQRADEGMEITVAPKNRPPFTLLILPNNKLMDLTYREQGRPEPPNKEEKCDEFRVSVVNGSASERHWQETFDRIVKHVAKRDQALDGIRFSSLSNRFQVEVERQYVNVLMHDIDAALMRQNDHYPSSVLGNVAKAVKILYHYRPMVTIVQEQGLRLRRATNDITEELLNPATSVSEIDTRIDSLSRSLFAILTGQLAEDAVAAMQRVEIELEQLRSVERQISGARSLERGERVDLDHKKLLDYLIDEKREKWIELAEGTRSHIASVDNYLKRLSIALEDDFKVQFYDPAFRGVRGAARTYDVSLGQVERTTILTNNRALAVVRPQATMEFDLPKRSPAIVEAMSGAQALMQDYGTLLQDPTFVGLSGMLSGTPVVGNPQQRLGSPAVRTVVPGLDSQPNEEVMAQSGGPNRQLGAAIEGLIPEPAIYKFETGTGFQIRPVIQPDGHSLVYNFNYMYTTNVREPVAADEKHLGRIKRHYIDTEVQTSSFELREISRYQVALKASRTSRGVPLLEDVPGVGVLFRPLPSDESSLQQNIILGHSTVYPTLFDLMGLRWSRHVADLDHMNLRDTEHVIRGRNRVINDFVFERASSEVDDFLRINDAAPRHYRPDLYHRQDVPTPYHPSGYIHTREAGDTSRREGEPLEDPTGRDFHHRDRRPIEHQYTEPFDSLRRGPIDDYRNGRESVGQEMIEEVPPNTSRRTTEPTREGVDAERTFSTERETISPQQPAPQFPPDVSPESVEDVPARRSLLDRLLRRG